MPEARIYIDYRAMTERLLSACNLRRARTGFGRIECLGAYGDFATAVCIVRFDLPEDNRYPVGSDHSLFWCAIYHKSAASPRDSIGG